MSWSARVGAELDEIRRAGRWRALRSFDALGPTGALDGRPVVSYASNDYLGLSAHPAVMEAATAAIARWGTGSTASRLVVGTRPVHEELEADLAAWKHAEHAVVTATGFAANLSVLTVFGGPGVTIFSDELNHASIIDGCRLSRSKLVVYPHGELDCVAAGLARVDGPAIVVTDAVFSMDGDLAPVAELSALTADHGALLVLDEAHSVLGPDVPLHPDGEVLRVGTLSKTLGSQGGFVAGRRPLIDLLVNRARALIFSTGLTPADTAAGLAALRIVRSAEGERRLDHLRSITDRVRPGHPSPIIPWIIGDEAAAVAAAEWLLDRGILIPAIRPPTVPVGTSRLRIALSAAHTDTMIDDLIAALVALDPA